MTGIENIYPFAVLLVAYIVMGITGFGSALVAVPLLAWFWPLPEVVALVILLDVPASALHGGLNFKTVKWSSIRHMMPGMFVGTFVGWWLMGMMEKRWPLFLLGVYIAFVGLKSLRNRTSTPDGLSKFAFHMMSTLVGVIEVMFATAGPIVLAILQRTVGDVRVIRATVPVVMVVAGSIAITVLLATQNSILEAVGPRWLLAFPVAAVGVWIGNRVAVMISMHVMKSVIALLLSASGIALTRHLWM